MKPEIDKIIPDKCKMPKSTLKPIKRHSRQEVKGRTLARVSFSTVQLLRELFRIGVDASRVGFSSDKDATELQ